MQTGNSNEADSGVPNRPVNHSCAVCDRPALLLAMLLLALGLTNRWLSVEQAVQLEQATDIRSYLQIAALAPALPPADAHLISHHAQRFLLPYVVGTVAFYAHLSPQLVFRGAVLVLIVVILRLAWRIFQHLQLPVPDGLLCLSLFILHPYALRYYLAIPAMANDLLFVVGLLLLIHSLFRGRLGLALAAVVIGTIAKQTMLLLLPVAAWWILFHRPWNSLPLSRRLVALSLIILPALACYEVTAWVARGFAAESLGAIPLLTGLLRWCRSDFNAPFLANFLFRGLLPFLFPLSIMCAVLLKRRPALPPEFYFLIAVALSCCVQPLLSGPVVCGHAILRLNALACLPVLAALGLLLREAKLPPLSSPALLLCGSFIALGSLHHRLIYNGPAVREDPSVAVAGSTISPAGTLFICLYCVMAFLTGVLFWLASPRSAPRLTELPSPDRTP